MRRSGAVAVLALAVGLTAAGGVVASVLQDAPQDARPASPTADLNRQQPAPTTPATVPPPAASAPAESAPAADPAPARPVPVTPPADTPLVVVAEDEADPAAEAAPEVPVTKPVEKAETVEPGRRQRRRVAVIQAIDKVTAETMRFEVEVGGRPVRFAKTLIFTARACEVSASDEQVEDAIAYLEISQQPRGIAQAAGPREVFRGWMFASTPGVSGLEHPVYDAWVVGCRAK